MAVENSTPGPWEAKPNGSGNWIIKSEDCGIVVHRSYYPGGMTPATAEADARLIASAPELYEACKGIVCQRDVYGTPILKAIEEKLLAAIAKAEVRE